MDSAKIDKPFCDFLDLQLIWSVFIDETSKCHFIGLGM